MTGIKAREEIVLTLGDKFLNVVKEVNREQTERISLLEVIIACGILQLKLYETGYRDKEKKTEEIKVRI